MPNNLANFETERATEWLIAQLSERARELEDPVCITQTGPAEFELSLPDGREFAVSVYRVPTDETDQGETRTPAALESDAALAELRRRLAGEGVIPSTD